MTNSFVFMMPRTGIEPARITPHAPQTCASTNSATWAGLNIFKDYLFVFAFVSELPAELLFAVLATVAVAEFELAFVAVFVFVALPFAVFMLVSAGFVSFVPEVVCKTETFPVKAGNDKSNAESIKIVAAVMVIFDKTDCVPRGPNAVLEILLVKSAPASVLPGCKSTVATKTKHEIKNNPYRKYANKILFLP